MKQPEITIKYDLLDQNSQPVPHKVSDTDKKFIIINYFLNETK